MFLVLNARSGRGTGMGRGLGRTSAPVKKEIVAPTTSKRRKLEESGKGPVVHQPSQAKNVSQAANARAALNRAAMAHGAVEAAIHQLPPLPPPSVPHPDDAKQSNAAMRAMKAAPATMGPPEIPKAKRGSGWLSKRVALSYMVEKGRLPEAQLLVKQFQGDKNFNDAYVQHSGLMRSTGSDPKRDYLKK
jgi:hypothetical protein